MEIWKDIVGYEGLYQISNLGRVKSLNHTTTHRGFELNKKGKMLSVRRDGKGYHQYRLYNGGKSTYQKAHRLVALHFLNNPDNLPQVNHIDKNKENNSSSNLEWCTGLYNMQHFFAKEYLLLSPNGEEVSVKNLSDFCRKHGLSDSNLHKTLHGDRNHHRGWKLCQVS